MLQQTQVATVVPYFRRFLARFPDLPALARANEQDVLQLWEGLGYYRRARDLHRAARQMAADHAGRLPDDPAVLARLPGFGRYTVNAVLSQAHDRRLPILEANSVRVLCRLLGVRDDPKQGATQKVLWQAAEALLPRRRVGDFNQGHMELGALVCTPARPDCPRCPLRARCFARVHGLQQEIPLRGARENGVAVEEVAIVLRQGHQVLLVQRPEGGRWGNMWEFPHATVEPLETHEAAAGRLLADLGMTGAVCGEITTIRHAVTRFRITMTCIEARHAGGEFRPGRYVRGVWLPPAGVVDYPLSVPQRRLADRVAAARG
jgi:A/G-specific adenine glycosylase